MKKKVLVGMSGGVDSSVAALMLFQQGYDVMGCTLLLFGKNTDTYLNNAADAKAVCDQIGIPHITLETSKPFKEKVIDYFCNEYISGRTPNPCAVCNQNIKFGYMMDYALKNGFSYIATGHYAKIKEENGHFFLHRSKDTKKDQSYFLYHLDDRTLSYVLFPLNELSKDDIRKIAEKNDLKVAKKPDSQEICFVPDDDYIAFLEKNVEVLPGSGNFINRDGDVIGMHQGVFRYTIGQRKGLGMTFGKPMFVIDINAEINTVTLGESGSEYKSNLLLQDVKIAYGIDFTKDLEGEIKLRYGATPGKAVVIPTGQNTAKVILEKPARAVTPGQVAVLYNEDKIILGGIIKY